MASSSSGDILPSHIIQGQDQNERNVQNLQQNENVSRRIEDVVQPLSTQRLRPIRQQTKNAVANILSTGEVCLEFISKKRGKEKIQDVMRISGDGQRVVIYNLGRTQYSFQFDGMMSERRQERGLIFIYSIISGNKDLFVIIF